MTVAAIVPAAGRGERLGPGAPKALRRLGDRTLLEHAVFRLRSSPSVSVVVVAAPVEDVALVRALLGSDAIVVPGGATRTRSVAAALAVLPAAVDVVLVHDAARCLAPVALVERVVAAIRSGAAAAVPGQPVADTIKRVAVDGLVVATLDRTDLRLVQTPQGFQLSVLRSAHALPGAEATDDAGLVESMGLPVLVVPGSDLAFKITTPTDLAVAAALLERSAAV